ncbi:MAG TPA: hypothetical protein VMB18_11540 [Terriglobales bacterium]|jgi:hypothetical protein|nr:hypothetical protein [Terriglobales bacterium]
MKAEITAVHLLWFVHEEAEGNDEALLIGVYSTEEKAKAAIQRLRDKPGFCRQAEGFQIHTYEVDHDHWTDGYIVK